MTLNNTLGRNAFIAELKDVINNSPIFPKIRHVFIGVDYTSKVLGKELLSLLKPAGIWVGHAFMETYGNFSHQYTHHNNTMQMGRDGRGDCRTSLPDVTNYASFMSMRAPNSWHIPNPGLQFNRHLNLGWGSETSLEPSLATTSALGNKRFRYVS